jgi:AcrR family transcriptional regulator
VARARRPNQKEFIRQQAAQLFAKNGYHATGIQEISDAVGLGRGALYHHIRSKEDLLYEISVLHVDELIADADNVVESDLACSEKLRTLSRLLMRNIAENVADWTVFFNEVNTLSPPNRGAVVARREQYEALWARVITDGMAAGEFRDVDPVIVKGVLGMHNYSYLWIRRRGRLAPEALAALFSDVLLNGLNVARSEAAV